MSLTRLALKFAVPAVKLEAYRRYLFIGPHPDDIEIGAGATARAMTLTSCFAASRVPWGNSSPT